MINIRTFLFTIFLFVFSDLFCQNISDGLLLDYPFDGDATDFSGNDYDGLIFGASFGIDRFGNEDSAAYFDGVDDYINFPNILELKPNLPISFSFWIKYDDMTYENSTVFNTSFEENINSGVYMNIQSSTGKYQISYGDGSNYYTSASRRTHTNNAIIQPNEWHHIVVLVNSALSMKIFVDCNNDFGSYSGTGGELQYSNLPGVIGRHDRSLTNSADYFKGAVDDFKYWSRTLTVSEINSLCNNLSIADESPVENTFLTIYPNPSKDGIFNIKTNINDFNTIKAYNVLGELVYSDKYNATVDLSNLSSGMYFVRIEGSGKTEIKKLVIK